MTHADKPEEAGVPQPSPNTETNNAEINNTEIKAELSSALESPAEVTNDSRSSESSTEATNPTPVASDTSSGDSPAPPGEASHAIESAPPLSIEEADQDTNLEIPDLSVVILQAEASQVTEENASGNTEMLSEEHDSEMVPPGENTAEAIKQQNSTEIHIDQLSDAQSPDETEPSLNPPPVPDETLNLKQEIVRLQQQLAQSEQRSNQLEQQLRQRENQSANLTHQSTGKEKSDMELEPIKDLNELIDNACRNDAGDCDADNQELIKHQDQIQRLLDLGAILRQGMEQVIHQCADSLLPACRSAREKLPPDLQAQIQSRHDALELIGRMVDRLREAIGKLGNNDSPSPALVKVNKHELIILLNEAYRSNQETIDKAMLRKVIDKKLKEVSNQRYQQITETRSLVESQRHQLLNLVKQKILPILDGFYEGQHHSEKLIQELASNYPDQQATLNQWLQFHSDLHDQIQSILTQIGIHPMNVQPGDAADYNRHFPLGVEPDPALPNEHVKEVSQQGYEYKEADQPVQVLRPAQVIMVKN